MLPAEIRLLHIMGIIYEGYRYPTFWTERVLYATFQDENVKNLLTPAVNRGDLRRLKFTTTPFSDWAAPRTLLGEQLMTLSQTPELDEEGYFLPILLPSRLWTQGRLVLLLNWYLHFLDQSHASGLSTRICCRICGMLTDGNWRIHTPSRLSRSCLLAVAAAAHLGGIVDRRPG